MSVIFHQYKSFISPNLNYGDILYDKPENQTFQNKLEKVQHKVCLAIAGAIQGASRQKIYYELGLQTLIERRWRSKLTFFCKIVNGFLVYTRISLFLSEFSFTIELPFKISIIY